MLPLGHQGHHNIHTVLLFWRISSIEAENEMSDVTVKQN